MQKYFLKLIIIPLALIFLHPFSFAKTTLAILDFEGRNISQGEALTLTDRFRNEIIKTNKYIIVERAAMDEILKEQGFQQTGCTSNECVVEVGQLLGVRQMISGSIGKVGDIFTVSVRIIDIQTGKILNMTDYDNRGDISEMLTRGMKEVVLKLVTGKDIVAPSVFYGEGSLYLSTIPPGATVTIDNRDIDGTTPLTIGNLSAGEHFVEVEKGNTFGRQTVNIESNVISRATINLGKYNVNLNVFSTPDSAQVSIDAKQYGTTPLTITDLSLGTHRLKVDKTGFVDHISDVLVEKGKVNTVEVTLDVTPQLTINSNPTGANIRISGHRQEYLTPNKYMELNPGEYQITLIKQQYEPYTEVITLKGGDVKVMNVSLVRKTGSIHIESTDPVNAEFELIEDKTKKGVAPQTLENIPSGSYTILFHKTGFLSLERKINIDWKKTTSVSASLKSIDSIEKEIRSLRVKRNLWIAGGTVLTGIGGYLRYSAEKHYDEYLTAGSEAGDLHKTVEMEDSTNPIVLGMGGGCFFPSVYYHTKMEQAKKLLKKGVIRE